MNWQILVVIVLLIGGAGWMFNHQIEARIVAEQSALAERTRADLAETRVAEIERKLEQERERQQELLNDLQEARDVEAKATEVLEDRAKLDRATQGKPTLIERLARKKTTQVWSEISEESRE